VKRSARACWADVEVLAAPVELGLDGEADEEEEAFALLLAVEDASLALSVVLSAAAASEPVEEAVAAASSSEPGEVVEGVSTADDAPPSSPDRSS
jgi:hypothetical protein